MSFLWSPTELPGHRSPRSHPPARPSRREAVKACQARCLELQKLGLPLAEIGKIFDRTEDTIWVWIRQAEQKAQEDVDGRT